MRRRIVLAFAAALAAIGSAVATSVPAQAAALSVSWNWLGGFVPNLPNAATPPPGANDFSCRSAKHPVPVVLVHGTWEHQADNWQALSPYLKNQGFCVFSFNYGGNPGDVFWGYKSIKANAAELKTFVETQVLPRTGATKVDIVGHSQGGMMPRYYIKFGGGMKTIRSLVGLAPSNHGTTLSGIADLGKALGLLPAVATIQPAAIDQTIGSAFMKELDTCPGGAAPADICPGDPVKYTVIITNGDQIVTPYTNAFLKGATNIELNKVCPWELSEHLGMTYSRNTAFQVLKALDPSTRGKVCVLSLPYVGG